MVQGGLWDPDAGLVIPRSQTVAGKLVDQARGLRQAQGIREHAGQVAGHRERPHQRAW